MKKISIFLLTIGLSIAFVACNGTKKTERHVEEPVKNEVVEDAVEEVVEEMLEEVTAPPPPPLKLNPESALKAFQEYAKSYAEAYNNIMKAPQKFKDLSSQYQIRIKEMEEIKSELNEKQQKEYQKAIDLITKVNKGGK